VYGNVGNIAQASTHVTQSAGVTSGGVESLIRKLSDLGVGSADSGELRAAIKEDGRPKGEKLVARVAVWVGGMIAKAMIGTWTVATSTATTVLPKLIAKY
jgi:hypothetical protein